MNSLYRMSRNIILYTGFIKIHGILRNVLKLIVYTGFYSWLIWIYRCLEILRNLQAVLKYNQRDRLYKNSVKLTGCPSIFTGSLGLTVNLYRVSKCPAIFQILIPNPNLQILVPISVFQIPNYVYQDPVNSKLNISDPNSKLHFLLILSPNFINQIQITNFIIQIQITNFIFQIQITNFINQIQIPNFIFQIQITNFIFQIQITNFIIQIQIPNFIIQILISNPNSIFWSKMKLPLI